MFSHGCEQDSFIYGWLEKYHLTSHPTSLISTTPNHLPFLLVPTTTTTSMASTSMFLQCPAEIRELIYNYAFEDHPIHVCDSRLKRSIGGPHRPANRRLPGLLHVNKQIYKEAWTTLAQRSVLVFNDYINFAQLASVVPQTFAKLVRHISLRGDVVPGQSLDRFLSLEGIHYQVLGNCFFVSSNEKGAVKRVTSNSDDAEMVEAVMGRSAALILIRQALQQRNEVVSLKATARIMSPEQQQSVTIDVNSLRIIHRF